MRLAAELRPDPLGELTALPQTSSWIQWVLLLGGGEGRKSEGEGREGRGKARGWDGGNGRGGKGRGNAPNFVSCFRMAKM